LLFNINFDETNDENEEELGEESDDKRDNTLNTEYFDESIIKTLNISFNSMPFDYKILDSVSGNRKKVLIRYFLKIDFKVHK
jgi:hypothetical protein